MSNPAPQSGRRSVVWRLTVGLCISACLVCVTTSLLPFASVRAWVDHYAGDGSAEPYTPELHGRLQRAALAAAAVLLTTAILWWKRGRDWLDQLSMAVRQVGPTGILSLKKGLRDNRYSLFGVTVVATALRLIYLRQPMRYDEAQAFVDYASQPLFVTVSKYDFPNNHVLHSLLVAVSTRVFGESEAAIRLPAFLAGILLAPASALLAWRVSGSRTAALMAGLTTACSSVLIEYSTNARGYKLVALCALVCWWLAVDAAQGRWRLAGATMVLIGALGLWTVPVMLYPLVMIWCWLLLASPTSSTQNGFRERLTRCAVIAALTLVLASLFYTPVFLVSGPRSLVDNAYVQSLPASAFFDGLRNWAEAWFTLLSRGVRPLGIAVIIAGIGFTLADRSSPRGALNRRAVTSFLAMLALILAQRVLPPARIGLFLVPLIAVASGAGWGLLLERAAWPLSLVGSLAIFAAIAVGPVATKSNGDLILNSAETGCVPDCRGIAELIKSIARDREPVICICPVTAPLKYYAREIGFDMRHFDWPGTQSARGDIALLVTSSDPGQTVDQVLRALHLDRSRAADYQVVRRFSSASLWRLKEDATRLSPSSAASPTHP